MLASWGQAAEKKSAAEKAMAKVPVFYKAGQKRVHLRACSRLPKDRKALEDWTEITLADVDKMGLALCSKCPGKDIHKVCTELEDDTMVFHSPGKKKVHVRGCKRLVTLELDDLKKVKPMTFENAEKKGLSTCSKCLEQKDG